MTQLIQDIIAETADAQKDRTELEALLGSANMSMSESFSVNVVTEGFWGDLREKLKSKVAKAFSKLKKARSKPEFEKLMSDYGKEREEAYRSLRNTLADQKWVEEEIGEGEVSKTLKYFKSTDDFKRFIVEHCDYFIDALKVAEKANKELSELADAYAKEIESADESDYAGIDKQYLEKAKKVATDCRKDLNKSAPKWVETDERTFTFSTDNFKGGEATYSAKDVTEVAEAFLGYAGEYDTGLGLGLFIEDWSDAYNEYEDSTFLDFCDWHRMSWDGEYFPYFVDHSDFLHKVAMTTLKELVSVTAKED